MGWQKIAELIAVLAAAALSAWQWRAAQKTGSVFLNLYCSFDRDKQPTLFKLACWFLLSLSAFLVVAAVCTAIIAP